MYSYLYKIDYVLQRFFTSLIFTFPLFNLIKKSYFFFRYKTKFINATTNVVITCFDKRNERTGISFKGKCTFSRNIEVDTSGGIEVGRNVTISDNVTIQTHKHLYAGYSIFENVTSSSFLKIEDEVWVCNNVVITSSVNYIGKGAIIAAGSVVTKNVDDFSIVAGIPAKHLNNRKIEIHDS